MAPGKYTLIASGVGFNKKTITNVSVSIDLTTTIDIVMSSQVVDVGEEVVVTAQRPLVQRDLAAKTAVIEAATGGASGDGGRAGAPAPGRVRGR